MKAVILAAGIGSRLRPITLAKPKCCVNVDSTPVLEHQLRAYADAGISKVTVVAGYMADQTRQLCRSVASDYTGVDVSVVESEVFANTDNMYSLSLAREHVAGEPFLLSNGDVVFDPDVVEYLVSETDGSAVACDTSTFSTEAMKVVLNDEGYVDGIRKDIAEAEAYAPSIDLYRFSSAFSSMLFDRIRRTIEIEEDYTGWTEAAIDDIVSERSHDLRPLDISGARWVEIDNYQDLLEADAAFSSLGNLGSKGAVFFDLDGTLYLDDELVDGAREVVAELRSKGVAVYFLTNNSSRWKTDYAEKLDSLGVRATPDEIILSTDGVITYLRENDAASAHVVGTEAMQRAIEAAGIDVDADRPEFVVVGFDTELTYEKVRDATLAIRDGAEYLLAHPDRVCPTAEGFVPDCGAIGALVEAATDQSPAHVFGKPNPEMIEHVLDERNLTPENVAIVGDRLETEIRMADSLGCESVCVLTGDADRADVETSAVQPTAVVESIGDLTDFLGMIDGSATTVTSQQT